MTLILLSGSEEIYRLSWKDLRIDPHIMIRIFSIGMPAGIQSVITSFSNVFVQSYVNYFGSSVMAGWSCYNKLDQFIMLPIQSMAMAATTFVSQNIGAGNEERAGRGTRITVLLSVSVTASIALLLYLFAAPATRLFPVARSGRIAEPRNGLSSRGRNPAPSSAWRCTGSTTKVRASAVSRRRGAFHVRRRTVHGKSSIVRVLWRRTASRMCNSAARV